MTAQHPEHSAAPQIGGTDAETEEVAVDPAVGDTGSCGPG